MFDIGFTEILLVLVVALIVIGPERMPEVARSIGRFVGKTKRFVNSIKEDSELTSAVREIQESINLEEEKKQLESVTETLHDDFDQMQQEWGIDEEISRPTFGGAEPANNTDSQFNKAPQQPTLPETEQQKKADKSTVSGEKTPVPEAAKTVTPDNKAKTAARQEEKA